MRTAAQFLGELSHLHDSYRLTVFLTKKCHRAGLFRFLDRHHLRLHSQILRNLLIDDLFHTPDLIRRHSRRMGEVETSTLSVLIGTGLLHMAAQHLSERFLQQVCCTVVLTGAVPPGTVHRQSHLIAYLEHALCHPTYMSHFAAKEFHGILYLKFAVRRGDNTQVSFLSAHGSIEGCLLHDHRTYFTVRQRFHQLRLRGEHRHLRFKGQSIISYKLSRNRRIDGLIYRHIRSHIVGRLAGFASLVLLFLHTCLKSVLVHRESILLQDLLCQVERETVRIIQFECFCAAQHFAARSRYPICHLI